MTITARTLTLLTLTRSEVSFLLRAFDASIRADGSRAHHHAACGHEETICLVVPHLSGPSYAVARYTREEAAALRGD